MPVLVPGGLEQDRLTPTQPNAEAPQTNVIPALPRKHPWATFRVDKHQDPDLSTGGQAIDHRLVTVEIRGLKPDVTKALGAARGLYLQKVLLMPTNQFPNVVGGQAMAVLEVAADDLHKDETIRAGEDIWIGTLAAHVMHHRQYGLARAPATPSIAAAPSSLLTGLADYFNFVNPSILGLGVTGKKLTNNGPVTQTSGPNSKAASFSSGNPQYFSGPTLARAMQFTDTFWMQTDRSNGPIWGDFDNTSNNGYLVELLQGGGHNNAIILQIGSANGQTNNFDCHAAFSHFAIVFDGTQNGNANRLKIYVNGVPQGLFFTGTIPAVIPYTNASFFLGGAGGLFGAGNFAGQLAECGFWNVPLTATQIAAMVATVGTYPFADIP